MTWASEIKEKIPKSISKLLDQDILVEFNQTTQNAYVGEVMMLETKLGDQFDLLKSSADGSEVDLRARNLLSSIEILIFDDDLSESFTTEFIEFTRTWINQMI